MAQRRYRSFFWPALLILIGLIALLANTGQITTDRLILIVNMWPLILIVIGVELMVRRSLHGPVGDAVAALVVLIAVIVAATYVALAPNPAAAHTLDVSAPAGELSHGAVEIDVGSGTITIGPGAGEDLYHAHIRYSGDKPDVSLDRSSGRLRIRQQNNSFFGVETPRFVLDLQLDPAVTWKIGENTGATTDTLNLSQLPVSGISVNTGASTENITLGPPAGVVQVDVNGGALTVHVHRPAGTEASISVAGGANSLTADSRSFHGIGDLSYQSSGFSTASDAYRIRVNGGACTATLDSSAPSD